MGIFFVWMILYQFLVDRKAIFHFPFKDYLPFSKWKFPNNREDNTTWFLAHFENGMLVSYKDIPTLILKVININQPEP